MDRYDQRILEELQQDGRVSNQDLADRIGLSPSPCLRRVRQLEEDGIIDRYVALLRPEKLGLKLTALIQISMDKHTPERFENFERQVKSFPEVQSCYLITGQSADYILRVVVPDMERYQEFLLGKLTRIEGVSGVHSSFVMRKVVDSTAVPLNAG
ncbi:MAG: Lrp/AsnC family transcriptional regulator [Gammaproteobacteria bacterium]|nr:Lrp/AsnC family transcriptional regulator [Gammaproteobacteria bacterium]